MVRKERRVIDIGANPALLRIVREMQDTQQSYILCEDDREVGVLSPSKPASTRRAKGKVFTKADPLWDIVGILKDDGGPTDVSTNVDKYLADAYSHTHA